MNVFVLCSGRCGSLSFAKACGHITNYTVGHETRTAMIGSERVAYPDNHIEVDNRLSFFLGRLDAAYGNRAFYVHLVRDPYDTAHSFARRTSGIIDHYSSTDGIFIGNVEAEREQIALDYVRRANENIELFLKDKTGKMLFRIEQATERFPLFCRYIGAQVDMRAALTEFEKRYNESKK